MGIRIDGRFSAGAADGFVADAENIAAKENGEEITLEQKLDNLLSKAKQYADAVFEALKLIEIGTRPEIGLPNKIYLEPKTSNEENDLFDEYLWVNNKWEFVGTKKLDANFSDYVKNNEEGWATQAKAGTVLINPNKGIGRANLSPALEIVPATDDEIRLKTNTSKPIVPARLNNAVKYGITGNDSTLTEIERLAAHKWLQINNNTGDGSPMPSLVMTFIHYGNESDVTLYLDHVEKIEWGDGTYTTYDDESNASLNKYIRTHSYQNMEDEGRVVIRIYGPSAIREYAFSEFEHDILHILVGRQISSIGRRILPPGTLFESVFTEMEFVSEYPPRISEVMYSEVLRGSPMNKDTLYPTFSQDTGLEPDVAKIFVPFGSLELYKYYWYHLYDKLLDKSNKLNKSQEFYYISGTIASRGTDFAKVDFFGYTSNLDGLYNGASPNNLYGNYKNTVLDTQPSAGFWAVVGSGFPIGLAWEDGELGVYAVGEVAGVIVPEIYSDCSISNLKISKLNGEVVYE